MLSRSWKPPLQYCKPRPQGRRFISAPSFEILGKRGLFPSCDLLKQGDYNARAAEGATRGGERYMTSSDMYRHLNRIQELVLPRLGARTRPQIETILFRASAMLQGGREMVSWTEDGTHPLFVPYLKGSRFQKLSGTAGYNAFVVRSAKQVPVVHTFQPPLYNSLEREGLFIAESAVSDLFYCLPHVVTKVYGSAIRQKVKTIRGAISNGHEWAFLILRVSEDGKGWRYNLSSKVAITFEPNYPNHITNHGPDVVAGILAHWAEHCYDDIDENDWFKVDEDKSQYLWPS